MKKGLTIFGLVVVIIVSFSFFGWRFFHDEEESKGDSPQAAGNPEPPYYKTQFQDESQFIVEEIVTDMAEMIWYAKNKNLPNPQVFQVHAIEKPKSAFRAPVYDVTVTLSKELPPLKVEISLKQSAIWDPQAYGEFGETLVKALGIEKVNRPEVKSEDAMPLKMLTTLTAEMVEQQNMFVSNLLQNDFKNPVYHENAAIVLGAFCFRENAGWFYDIRLPLSRMTSHLALAKAFSNQAESGVSSAFAKAILETLMGNQKPALDKIEKLDQSLPEFQAWARALKSRNTNDYRDFEKLEKPTLLEKIEYFHAMSGSIHHMPAVLERMTKHEMENLSDWPRMICAGNYSVQNGHLIAKIGLALEFDELNRIYQLANGVELNKEKLIEAYNQLPERAFTTGSGNDVKVKVIGWGQWSYFLQRHFCHITTETFRFMNRMWGVHEAAAEFSKKIEEMFLGLRMYPLIRKANAADEGEYRKGVDECLALTVKIPHLVPPYGWILICTDLKSVPQYRPQNPHANEWLKHNPPPGTVYDMAPRFCYPSLTARSDVVDVYEKLHAQAPFAQSLTEAWTSKKYGDKADWDKLEEAYRPILDYNVVSMYEVSQGQKIDPSRFETLLSKAAEVRANYWFELQEFFIKHGQDDKAAMYGEKGVELCQDAVEVSQNASWLIKYYMKKGQKEKAEKLADMAAEVYSYMGLESKADLMETEEKYEVAFEYFQKIEERYNDSTPVIMFCQRYELKMHDGKYESELKSRLSKIFPDGIQKYDPANFKDKPKVGIRLNEINDLMKQSGLVRGGIIVAINGIVVTNYSQYGFAMNSNGSPDKTLIVWQQKKYVEIKASLPTGRFNGGQLVDYKGK